MTIYSISVLAMILFSIGVIGVIARRNIFIIYMSIELILNAINLLLIAFARYQGNMDGQILSIMIIAIAAAEAAVFFSIIILLFRSKGSLDTDIFTSLKERVE